MSQPVIDWLENSLHAERQSLNLLLQERHRNMVQALALELQGVSGNNKKKTITAFDFSALGHGPVIDIDTLEPRTAPVTAPVPMTRDTDDVGVVADVLDTAANKPKCTSEEKPGQEPEDRSCRERARCLLNDRRFEAVIAAVILANSLIMGVEAQMEIEGRDLTVFRILEHVFLACYTIELCLWIFAFGFSILRRNGWVAFDALLVAVGILGNYIIGPIVESSGSDDGSLKNTLAGLLVLRILRLFKIARILRLLFVFKVLWMLIRGLLCSAATICYTMGLILVMVYMFACMSIELITKKQGNSEDERVSELVAESFSNLPITMLSLLQFVSIDGIADLYVPLVKADPALILFFLPFILIVSVSLMNLVTAVIVEGALQQGKEDREATARYKHYEFLKLKPKLVQWFKEMDVDGDSLVTRDELMAAPPKIKEDLQHYMESDNLMELFEMIDVDESGEVDIDEFCDGVGNLVCSDAPVELIRVMKQLKLIRSRLDVIHPRLGLDEVHLLQTK